MMMMWWWWRRAFVMALLLPLLHPAPVLALKKNCPRKCIPIDQCPELAKLIRTNITAVQEATCEVLLSPIPLVCCPGSSSEPLVVTPGPTRSNESPIRGPLRGSKPPTPGPVRSSRPPTPNPLLPKSCGEFFALDTRVFGGDAASIGNYPWMAALGFKNAFTNKIEFLCGGSVINQRYVLSAAHCFDNELAVVRLAEWDLSSDVDCERSPSGTRLCNPDPVQDFKHEEIIKHPDFKKRGLVSDDIALIRLAKPITFSQSIQPVCLPERGLDVAVALGTRRATAAGWGFTESGTSSDILLEVSLPHVDMGECNNTYEGKLVGKQLCFGGIAGQDSCGGDSGGPLVMTKAHSPPFTQIGIVSFGPRFCGRKNVPGVYASVPSYRDWIEENIRP